MFRLYHSKETILVIVNKNILIASDNRIVSIPVLLDLSSAFEECKNEPFAIRHLFYGTSYQFGLRRPKPPPP